MSIIPLVQATILSLRAGTATVVTHLVSPKPPPVFSIYSSQYVSLFIAFHWHLVSFTSSCPWIFHTCHSHWNHLPSTGSFFPFGHLNVVSLERSLTSRLSYSIMFFSFKYFSLLIIVNIFNVYFFYSLTYMYQACYMPDMLGARDTILSERRRDRHLPRIYEQQRYLCDFCVEKRI